MTPSKPCKKSCCAATPPNTRTALKALIESTAPGLLATNEPKAKDVDKSLNATLKTNQLKRYFEALPNLLLTNYLDFLLFVGGKKRMEINLGELNGQHVAPAKDAPAR